MKTRRNSMIRPIRSAACLMTACVCGNCIGGSLATSTGPRRSGPWSEASHQAAHVGEEVKFSFILTKPFARQPVHPAGIAEYCILKIDERPVEMELESEGKFEASFRAPADWVNREVRVTATAYRQYGQRDRIVHGKQLLESQRAADPRDGAIARDSITMLVYQSSLTMRVEPAEGELDFSAAHLVVRRADGGVSTVPQSGIAGRGFEVEGPTDSGAYTIRYQPSCEQINLRGSTQAELTVHDSAGRPTRQRAEFMTP